MVIENRQEPCAQEYLFLTQSIPKIPETGSYRGMQRKANARASIMLKIGQWKMHSIATYQHDNTQMDDSNQRKFDFVK